MNVLWEMLLSDRGFFFFFLFRGYRFLSSLFLLYMKLNGLYAFLFYTILTILIVYPCTQCADVYCFRTPQTKERGSTRVHALNNVNKVLQVLHQNNVSSFFGQAAMDHFKSWLTTTLNVNSLQYIYIYIFKQIIKIISICWSFGLMVIFPRKAESFQRNRKCLCVAPLGVLFPFCTQDCEGNQTGIHN